MPISLKPQDLAAACKHAQDSYSGESGYQGWLADLRDFLVEVQQAEHDLFVSPAFQEKLWNSEAISATGMGSVNVERVIRSTEVAETLWALKNLQPADSPADQTRLLKEKWDQCLALITPLVDRMPWLKMNRVFAALQPAHFTTVAHINKLLMLARAMEIPSARSLHVVELHQSVLDGLCDVLGPAEGDGVDRMTLPWLLYALTTEQGDDATTVTEPTAGAELLKPLPAARRRRGMLAIGGYFDSLLSMLEFAKEGCSREDLKAHIQSVNPKLKPSSVQTNLNALVAEWGALRPVGEHQLALTPRGEALLESSDPAEASDWLLTRILGFDHILYALRSGEKSVPELYGLLREVCPSWKSNFAPSSLIAWIRALKLATQDQNKILRLTEEGQTWAERIHWVPEKITAVAPDNPVGIPDKNPVGVFKYPDVSEIIAAMPPAAIFPGKLVAQLHAGLWSNDLRHFAVLTGLSGAGKTLLARSYALALRSKTAEPDEGLCTVPVQPGWHDPSCLLGYLNPLSDNSYVRTVFLDFLLRACSNPGQSYTVVLDEMNLSHPEQYLAPVLSAMETGEDIVLHMEDEDINGVPPSIPYPGNLVIIGTVNMDETTHGLSDKVLDRAAVLEFWDIDVAAFPGWNEYALSDEVIQVVKNTLVKLAATLRPVRLHFGWRSIGDILGYVRTALAGAGILDQQAALDAAIYSKLLPKLRGEDTPRLRKAFEAAHKVLVEENLPESAGKLEELIDDLKHLGSARFWR